MRDRNIIRSIRKSENYSFKKWSILGYTDTLTSENSRQKAL